MPVYEYSCNVCGTSSSDDRSIAERHALKPCENEECIGMRIKRVSGPAFHLKGNGWERDGYSSGGN